MSRKALAPGQMGAITVADEVRGGVATGKFVARVEVRRGDGSRVVIRRYRKTKTEARNEVKRLADIDRKKWGTADTVVGAVDITDDSTVVDLVRAYLNENSTGWKKATRDQYEGTLKRYISPALSSLTVRELSTRGTNAFLRSLGSASAWKSSRAVLGGAWRWAISEELIDDHDPIHNSKQPPKARPRKETVSAVNFHAFVAAATAYSYPGDDAPTHMGPSSRKPWFPYLLPLSLGTGARVGEVVLMRWEHLHRVDEHGNPVEGADWADGTAGRLAITLQGLKGRRSGAADEREDIVPRRVVVPKFAEDALTAWKKRQPGSPGGWVFPTANATHIPTSTVHRAWRTVIDEVRDRDGDIKAAGMPPRNHALRHTAITWIANDPSGGLDTAAWFAGHRRGGITEAVYVLPGLVDTSAILQRHWERGRKQN